MRRRPRITRRPCIALVLAASLGSAAAGCSDSGGTAATTPASSPPAPLVERTVRGGELAGFDAPPAEPLDLAEIARDNEVPVAELRRRGVRRAAKAVLAGPPEAFAISAVAELGTAAQARAEAARLFATNGSPEPGLSARPIDVPGIAGARGARKSGRRDGRDYVAFEIVWTDGALAHELFVLGRLGDVRADDVLAAAAAVDARTSGAPPAD